MYPFAPQNMSDLGIWSERYIKTGNFCECPFFLKGSEKEKGKKKAPF